MPSMSITQHPTTDIPANNPQAANTTFERVKFPPAGKANRAKIEGDSSAERASGASLENTGVMHPIEYVLLTIGTIVAILGVMAFVTLVKSSKY